MTQKMKTIFPLLFLFVVVFSTNVFAGDPPPQGDDPTTDPEGGTPIGGNAPVSSGLTLILSLGAAYGARKTYQLKNKE
jgi:hypothetical protein